MSVYIVVSYTDSGRYIHGVFDSLEAAEEIKEDLEGHPYETYKVIPLELNKSYYEK